MAEKVEISLYNRAFQATTFCIYSMSPLLKIFIKAVTYSHRMSALYRMVVVVVVY